MTNKQVAITHPEFGDGVCMESALEVWLAKGWTRKEADAKPEAPEPKPAKAPSMSSINVASSNPAPTQN